MKDGFALNPGDGKIAPPAERFDTVVVGAGASGTAAAIAAAASGSVLLVDEHPLPPSLIGSDVPLFWGGRATAAVQQPARLVETLLETNQALEEALDVGVDVRLGTMAWGLYANGPGLRVLPEPLLGLADAERAWFTGFGELVLATGARDVVLGFPGWDRPGVIGAQAFYALLTRYRALACRRIIVVGSGALAAATVALAAAHGIEVAAVLDVPVGQAVLRAEGGVDGVERVVLNGHGGERTLAADTIVLALAVEPATELLSAAGPAAVVRLVGDAALPAPDRQEIARWAAALAGPDDTIVCQCEGVTRGDLLGVQPPEYLARPPALAARNLASLGRGRAPDPDQIKRLTRAGMGACQGRRCRSQVAALLSQASRGPSAPATWRAPVRPVPLGLLADMDEPSALAAGWDVWFGIPTQWTPYADIGTAAEHVGGNRHV